MTPAERQGEHLPQFRSAAERRAYIRWLHRYAWIDGHWERHWWMTRWGRGGFLR